MQSRLKLLPPWFSFLGVMHPQIVSQLNPFFTTFTSYRALCHTMRRVNKYGSRDTLWSWYLWSLNCTRSIHLLTQQFSAAVDLWLLYWISFPKRFHHLASSSQIQRPHFAYLWHLPAVPHISKQLSAFRTFCPFYLSTSVPLSVGGFSSCDCRSGKINDS